MDDADIAQDRIETATDAAVAAIRARPRELKPTGACVMCEEVTLGLFCTQWCRDRYEAEERQRHIRGKGQ